MLKSKQLLGGLLIVGVSIALIQCTKKAETPTNNNTTGGGTTGTTTYTYNANVQAILAKDCYCHVTDGISPNLATYANVKSRASKVRSVIQPNGKMREYTDAKNAGIITNWIDGGTPE